ncbi:extracellular solute-binding protein [Streptomyces yunnanensis]|uniref:N,N'-diacetylchitobiose transport system substrate-binding protein n=1 Tax=Streptomyces yunnanensis TaxID=156453 RepID=A0A9X8QQ79_9ACTN|nr:extracellular solute-binding protein [Streptomyces yunnanensis]SHL22032.1 N,N'-diacetylchitobiose transport system substrate-binding protein [Streptomyces yunnanensis]
MKRGLIAATAVAGMLVSVAACGSSGGNAGADSFKGQKLTVWVMSGSNPDQWTKQVSEQFEKKTGATVEFKVQQWNGIQQKLSTALSEDTPPDVVEIGNTQTAAYAKAGALVDLGDLKKEIGADWNDAFNKAAMVDGKQYALPWFAGNRVVMYNKKIWAQAGIAKLPTTRAELFHDLDAIKQKTDAEPLYLPGQNWYFLDGLTIGTGAQLVKKEGGKWISNFSDPKVAKAMDIYKQYQAFSTAPKNKDEATPQQGEIFAKGKTGAIIAMGYEAATAIKANPKIKDDIGFFTIPGESAAKPEGVFLGGSNFAVAGMSKNQELAKEFLKVALSKDNDAQMVKESGWTPKSPALAGAAKNNPAAAAAAPAAEKSGGTTPLIPQWAAVENVPNPIKNYMTAVLNGKAPTDAAKDIESELNARLAKQ